MATVPDIAQVRYLNAMRLFDEFVRATVTDPDAAALRGLERRFAERLQIQPSYWSQIKSRARQIGERLARQFEVHAHKPPGWLDQPHEPLPALAAPPRPALSFEAARDEDERFIVSLVLSYYRRDPRLARARLLDLLGEVLGAPGGSLPTPPSDAPPPAAGPATPAGRAGPSTDRALWLQARAGVAPLKRRR